MGIFSGLEKFGLTKLNNTKIYDEHNEAETNDKPVAEKHVVAEEELLLDKTFTCPACGESFKTKMVRTGKAKLLASDMDLRPRYETVDALKYDAVVCPSCGFAALSRYFNTITNAQAKLVKEQISANFKGLPDYGATYTYEDAINRHKLSLISTIVKKGHASERAYNCLKLAWLYRSMAENIPRDKPEDEEKIKECRKEERELIMNAYEGFSSAFSSEEFPICGMDQHTVEYLIASLAAECGKYEDSLRMASRIITSRDANDRTKEKARDLKEKLVELEKRKNAKS